MFHSVFAVANRCIEKNFLNDKLMMF